MKKHFGQSAICLVFLLAGMKTVAQVNMVEFGKNRVQYQKFNWRYYQTDNFNSYFSQDGLELGRYVAQVAEAELPEIEEFIEYGLQRRANIVIYNNFDEMQQSNIGQELDWQGSGGITKLVNNKMMVYFDGNHANLRRQIRQGIARILVDNMLFGDDLGEFATNQALLDLPEWLTDGYVAFAAENWNPDLDDQLKSALLSGNYNNFYQLAFEKPNLAGHAFWFYIANKFGVSRTTYFFYLARIYRNLNSASQKIAGKKFKALLRDFMTEETQKYYKDIRGRRVVPKGQLSVVEEIGKKDFIRFNANPMPRSFTYAVVEFKQGKYSVILNENFVNRKVLLKYGTRTRQDDINPNYPILAWDGKGTRLACIYYEEGKLKLFVYDIINRIKIVKNRELTQFDQVQDAKFMLDANTLLLSAVKSGQTDIFVYKIDRESVAQVTNDVYDDLDASFVAFPNKTGIIFASNRPNATAVGTSDSLPAPHFNIFLVDNWNQSDFKQISQLTNVMFGDARYPSQYNTSHFTFVSDQSGINNRYAGFFSTERAGLDTLVFIGDEVLRNPSQADVDSLLTEWDKTDIDSVGYVSVTADSSYVFPLTNYQSSLLETRTAGDNQQVSEVVRQGDYKFLYRLKVDENALRRRNVTARPTEFQKKLIEEKRLEMSRGSIRQPSDSAKVDDDFFESEFQNDDAPEADSSQLDEVFNGDDTDKEPVLRNAKVYEYRPPKFFSDYLVASLNNTVYVINKYQPYAGGSGPIQPSNGNDVNGMLRVGTADLFEDFRVTGGFRIAPNLRDNDILFEFTNQRKRLDWGFTYFRSSLETNFQLDQGGTLFRPGKIFSNYYLARLKWPLDRVRSLRATIGPRFDRFIVSSLDPISHPLEDITETYGQVALEYVHDNTINPTQNIWKGLRWKAYIDWFTQLNDIQDTEGRFMFNAGVDARHYLHIYRNVIWAVRGAADFSWGNQKVIYYLGGVDGWLMLAPNQKDNGEYRYFNPANRPDPDVDYAFQALALNLRGFRQNVANGNNAVVLNSEIRLPVFSTFFNKPINNAFLRNFQLVQFIDLGTAWNGAYDKIERPGVVYTEPGTPVSVKIQAGGIGPFAGGYGFGARSTLLGYFVRFDAAWEMDGFFRGRPILYVALGFDF